MTLDVECMRVCASGATTASKAKRADVRAPGKTINAADAVQMTLGVECTDFCVRGATRASKAKTADVGVDAAQVCRELEQAKYRVASAKKKIRKRRCTRACVSNATESAQDKACGVRSSSVAASTARFPPASVAVPFATALKPKAARERRFEAS